MKNTSTTPLLLAACQALAHAALALPTISDVALSVNETQRRATITYVLSGGPAIVTADILTNGVSIGEANCSGMCLDVNKSVTNGTHEILWLIDHGDTEGLRLEGVQVEAKLTAWRPETPPDYLVVGLTCTNDVRYYTSTNALPGGVQNDAWRTTHIVMRKIPAAGVRCRLGCATGETGVKKTGANAYDTSIRETPRIVTFTNDFWMGIFEFTQGQFAQISTNNTSLFKGYPDSPFRPMEKITWNRLHDSGWPDSNHWVVASSQIGILRRRTGVEFDLPTDAQWEFACRAGCSYALYTGVGLTSDLGRCSNLDKIAWYDQNSSGQTHPVGLKEPNAWGLYDMLGNVWEWCLDWGNSQVAISGEESVEPVGLTFEQTINPPDTAERVKRGGSYYNQARSSRCASRGMEDRQRAAIHNTGFRLIAPITLKW